MRRVLNVESREKKNKVNAVNVGILKHLNRKEIMLLKIDKANNNNKNNRKKRSSKIVYKFVRGTEAQFKRIRRFCQSLGDVNQKNTKKKKKTHKYLNRGKRKLFTLFLSL